HHIQYTRAKAVPERLLMLTGSDRRYNLHGRTYALIVVSRQQQILGTHFARNGHTSPLCRSQQGDGLGCRDVSNVGSHTASGSQFYAQLNTEGFSYRWMA